jgi:glycosyltransferase involved in cell wall biosynthesis
LAAAEDVIAYPDGAAGRLGFGWLRATGGSRRLRRHLAQLRPSLVHAHFGGDAWLVSRTVADLGVPLVITLHGRDVTRQASRSGPIGERYRRNVRRAFDRASVVLTVSDTIRRRAIELGADPAKVRVHHTGVRIPDALPESPTEWDVLFVGRFVAKKGVDDLVEALGMLNRPRALFVGGGPMEPAIRRRAEQLGLDATFVGPQPPAAVRHHMARSKLFVSPSKSAADGDAEGLPTTILEAASHRIPTVSTRHSGIPEAVIDGVTGLLGAEGNRDELAANVRRLLDDDDLRAEFGRRARAHVAEQFDLVAQTRLLEQAYDSIVSLDRTPVAR